MEDQHVEILRDMVAPYQEDAKSLLRPDADFSHVRYSKRKDKKYGTYDGNYIARYRVLTGIQFTEDKAPYADLIRRLFMEEVTDGETNSFQGCGALDLASWLLKAVHAEDDVLLEKAKNANFDTFCGFDPDHIDKDSFTSDLSTLTTEDGLQLALCVEESSYANRLLGLWKNEQSEWNANNLQQLRFFEQQLGNTKEELSVLRQLFTLTKDILNDWDYCALSVTIAERQIDLNHPNKAFQVMWRMMPRLRRISHWRKVGLGRSAMAVCMDVVISGDEETASRMWRRIKPDATKMKKNMYLGLYKKSIQAAARMGDDKLARSLKKNMKAFKKRNKL